MRTLIRKLVLGTAALLGLGIGGAALDHAAEAASPAHLDCIPPASQILDRSQTADALGPFDARWVQQQLRKDDIRWAQLELRNRGLYNGPLDGVLGPKTKLALAKYQKDNGLGRRASLDARTWEALTDNPEGGQGSSMPPSTARNSSEQSDLGR
jgi:peptidoglycan hydrolase-like protein with peptidoglycan-binding domain